MDTAQAAARLGTTPRILRQFLRSKVSTFVAVGSGARYEFTEQDIPTLIRRFAEWKSGTRPKSTVSKVAKVKPVSVPATITRPPSKRDVTTWEEEGPVHIEDIRDPRVRARVKANARAAEDQLMMLLLAKGLHITQLGDPRKA